MASESFKFWDSFGEALDQLDDATYGRIVRAVAHKVFLDEDPDFSDCPLLVPTYTVMMRTAEQSRDIARRARENGAKSAGRPPKTTKRKTNQKPRNKSGLTKRKEANGEESSDSSPSLSESDGGGTADADRRPDTGSANSFWEAAVNAPDRAEYERRHDEADRRRRAGGLSD